MQEHRVILTYEAIYDVADIADYIEAYFGQSRADIFEVDIEKQFSELSYTAGIYGDTSIEYRGYIIYKKVFSPSLIFYIIKEDGIHVLRVLREERDWKNIMSEDREYTYPDK